MTINKQYIVTSFGNKIGTLNAQTIQDIREFADKLYTINPYIKKTGATNLGVKVFTNNYIDFVDAGGNVYYTLVPVDKWTGDLSE